MDDNQKPVQEESQQQATVSDASVQQSQQVQQPTQGMVNNAVPVQESDKEYVVVLILSYLLGSFGVDRFYVGKIGTGVLKLLTFGGFGIWWIIDFYVIGTGKFKDSNNLPLKGTASAIDIGKPVTIAIVIVTAITYVLSLIWVIISLVISIAAVSTIGNVESSVNNTIKEASQTDKIERDFERHTDVSNLVKELEIFYAINGYYPSLDELNNTTWRLNNMPNLTADVLTDPLSKEAKLLVESDTDNYGYKAVNVSGQDCVVGSQCVSYTITATKENTDGSTKIIKTSLN